MSGVENAEDVGINIVALYHPPSYYAATPELAEEARARQSSRSWRPPGAPSLRTELRDVRVEELEEQLRGSYEAYYSELHERMSRYRAAPDIFPETLLGPRHLIAELAADGVVVTHWPAQEQAFEFHISSDRLVKDITGLYRLWVPSGLSAKFLQYEPGIDFGALQMWRPELHQAGAVMRPTWSRIDIASLDSLDAIPTEEQAREWAEQDAQVAADAYLMGLAPALPGKEQQDRVVAELESAIDEFEKVLARAPDEKIVQAFLDTRRNKILLDPSALSIRPQVKLGSEYVPDFVIEVAKEQYVLVEIERPALPVLTEKGRPRAELVHAQQQVKDWFGWISDHAEYARSILPGISEPEGWVVMGRRASISPEHKGVLARENAESRRITTKTYDDLLDRAKQHLANLRSM